MILQVPDPRPEALWVSPLRKEKKLAAEIANGRLAMMAARRPAARLSSPFDLTRVLWFSRQPNIPEPREEMQPQNKAKYYELME